MLVEGRHTRSLNEQEVSAPAQTRRRCLLGSGLRQWQEQSLQKRLPESKIKVYTALGPALLVVEPRHDQSWQLYMQKSKPQYVAYELCSNGSSIGFAILVAQLIDSKFPRPSESEHKSDGLNAIQIHSSRECRQRRPVDLTQLEHVPGQDHLPTVKNNINRSKR